MVSTNKPAALWPDQIEARVTNLIWEQLASQARQSALKGEGKEDRKERARSRKTGGVSARSSYIVYQNKPIMHDLVRTAVSSAIKKTLGSASDFVVIQSRHRHQAKILWAVAKELPDTVERRQSTMLQNQIDALVDVYLPADSLAPALAALVSDNAKARAEFVQAIPMLDAERVADLAGHSAKNRSVTASRWKKAGRIFSVHHKGADLYPGFQFRDGRPHPTIKKLRDVLPDAMSGWQTAFWFNTANSWLGGATPIDRLDDDQAVVTAAKHEGEVWMG